MADQRINFDQITKLGSVGDPVLPQDAATKNYTDTNRLKILQPGAPTTSLGTVAIQAIAVGATDFRIIGDQTNNVFAGTPLKFGLDTTVYNATATNFDGASTRIVFFPALTAGTGAIPIGTNVLYGASTNLPVQELVIQSGLTRTPIADGIVGISASGGGGALNSVSLNEPSWRSVATSTASGVQTITVTDNQVAPNAVFLGRGSFSTTPAPFPGAANTATPNAGGTSTIDLIINATGQTVLGLAATDTIFTINDAGLLTENVSQIFTSPQFAAAFFTNSDWNVTINASNNVVLTYTGIGSPIPNNVVASPNIQFRFGGNWNGISNDDAVQIAFNSSDFRPQFQLLNTNNILPAVNGTPTNNQVIGWDAANTRLQWLTQSGGGGSSQQIVDLSTPLVADNSSIMLKIFSSTPSLSNVTGSIGATVADFSAVTITTTPWPPTISPAGLNQSFVAITSGDGTSWGGAGFVNPSPAGVTNIAWLKQPPPNTAFTDAKIYFLSNTTSSVLIGTSVTNAGTNPTTTIVTPEATITDLGVNSDTYGARAKQINYQPFIDGRIAAQIGSVPVPPGLTFFSTSTNVGTYVSAGNVFPITGDLTNIVNALLSIGNGIVQAPGGIGNWTLPTTATILVAISATPTATQWTRVTGIQQSALELNIDCDATNAAFFSGSSYPQTLFLFAQSFTFQAPPQAEIQRLARGVLPAVSQNFSIRDDVDYACKDSNNNTFFGFITSDRATANISFALAVADGTTVTNVSITFTSAIPASFINNATIVSFSATGLFNITLSTLSVAGTTYTLTGELNTIYNTSVPAGTYAVVIARATTVQTLQGLYGNVNLTSRNSSIAINVTGQNIDLASTGSGGGAASTNFEQIFQVRASSPTSIVTWGGVDSGDPYGYAMIPITDYTGGQINNIQYFQPANYVNPYGQPLTFPRAIGGASAPYSNFTTRMVMPTLNNVSMTLDVVPPSTGWSVNVWFCRIEAVNNADTAFDRANILPFMQAYNTGSDGPNNVPVQFPVLATPTISGNTITWPTINPGLWVGSVPEFGFAPTVPGSNQQYVPVFYLTHNAIAATTATFSVGSISGQGYYEMDLSLGTQNSPNTSLQQAVNIGNAISNSTGNTGTIQISDVVASPARTTILSGTTITTPNLTLPGVTSGAVTINAPATVGTSYSLTLPANAPTANNQTLLFATNGTSTFGTLPLIYNSYSNWTATSLVVQANAAIGSIILIVVGNATTTLANGTIFSLASTGAVRLFSSGATFDGVNSTVSLLRPLTAAVAVGTVIFTASTTTTAQFTSVATGSNTNAQVVNGVFQFDSAGSGTGTTQNLQNTLNAGNTATSVGAGNVSSFTLTDGTFTTTVNPTQVASQRLVAQNGSITTTIRANSSLTTAYGLFLPVAQSNNALNTIYTDTNGVMSFGLPAIGNTIFTAWNTTGFSNANTQAIGDESITINGNATTAIAAGDTISFLSGGSPRYTVEQVTFNSGPNTTTMLLYTGLTSALTGGQTIYKGTADSTTQRVNAVNVGSGLEYALVGGVLTLINSAPGGLGSIPSWDQTTAQGANSSRAVTIQASGFNGVQIGIPPTLSASPIISAIGPGATASIALAAKGASGQVLFGNSDLTTTTLSNTFSSTGVTLDALAGSGGGTPVFNFNKQVNISDGTATAGLQLIGGVDRGLRTTGSGVLYIGNASSALQFAFAGASGTLTANGAATDISLTVAPKGAGNFSIANTNNTLSVQLGAAGVTIIPTGPNVGANLTLSGQGAGANVIVGNTTLATGITVVGNSTTTSTIQATGSGTDLTLATFAKGSGPNIWGNANGQFVLTTTAAAFTFAPSSTVGGANLNVSLFSKGTGSVTVGNPTNAMVLTGNATNLTITPTANSSNINLTPTGLGNVFIVGQGPFSAAYSPKIIAGTSATNTALIAGSAGQALLSNGTTAGVINYWGSPITGGNKTFISITSTAVGDQTNDEIGFMTTGGTFNGTLTVQINGLNLTLNAAAGNITNWVAGAVYQLTMTTYFSTTINNARTSYFCANRPTFPQSFVGYGDGVSTCTTRTTTPRGGDALPSSSTGVWTPAATNTPLNLTYFTDALGTGNAGSVTILLIAERLS